MTKAASLLHLKNDLVEMGMLPWILLSSFDWSPLLVPSPRTRQGGWGWRSTSSPGTGAGVCLVQMLGRPGCWADDINGLGNWNYCPGEEARSCLLLPSHSWLCLLCMAGFWLDKKKKKKVSWPFEMRKLLMSKGGCEGFKMCPSPGKGKGCSHGTWYIRDAWSSKSAST